MLSPVEELRLAVQSQLDLRLNKIVERTISSRLDSWELTKEMKDDLAEVAVTAIRDIYYAASNQATTVLRELYNGGLGVNR